MNRQQRHDAKKKRRERANRSERSRRLEKDHCRALVDRADVAWSTNSDLDQVRRLLEKAIRIHPTSQEAHERLAELHIRAGRSAEGLAHFEQLVRPPESPQVTYVAAVAALRLDRFEQAGTLAKEFLQATSQAAELDRARAHAGQIIDVCRQLTRPPAATHGRQRVAARDSVPPAVTRVGSQSSLGFDSPRADGRAPDRFRRSRPGQPGTTAPDLPAARSMRESPAAAATGAGLPPFPTVMLPDLAPLFEIDDRGLAPDATSRPASAADLLLRRDYVELRLQKGFDELLSSTSVRGLQQFWFQQETVRRVLRDFRGRVLLADEVGLGKTIEACLVLKEYWMRGLVSKALILTPSSLVSQWVDELTSKFDLPAAVAESGKVTPDDGLWNRSPIVVASLPLVRQRAYRERLAAMEYDLLIVDEAHVLKNRTSAAWQLVNDLKKRFLLLLSATPVGNDLSELYNLILLLKPGLLRTEAQFRRDFGGLVALQDSGRRERLRELLREVMVRNTRAHIDVRLPRRLAATERVPAAGAEAELHEQLAAYVRARYGDSGQTERWRITMLQMQAGSSPAALCAALDRSHAVEGDLRLERLRACAAGIGLPAKTRALLELLRRTSEKKIVFTRFHATLDHLRTTLEAAGFSVAAFHGRMSAADKDRAIEQFADHAEVLISTEVGGEGRNLQFCRTVVNYDLPWNPMQLEQRVGRVHRIGQTREVFVFNFCLSGSVEEYILKVLHEKLNLFELVAGEIEMILGEFDAEREFGDLVMELWARSATPTERDDAFERLAGELIAARERYQRTQEIDRAVFREDFEV